MNEITPAYLPPVSLVAGILLTIIVTWLCPHDARRWGAAWIVGLLLCPLLTAALAGWPTLEEYGWQVARTAPVLWVGAVACFEVLRAFDRIPWVNDRTRDTEQALNGRIDKLLQAWKEQYHD